MKKHVCIIYMYINTYLCIIAHIHILYAVRETSRKREKGPGQG